MMYDFMSPFMYPHSSKISICSLQVDLVCTLGAEMFGVGVFCLEIRVIIKISSHPWYPRTFDWFSLGSSQKKYFWKKNSKMADLKKTEFFNYPQKLSNCRQNFYRLVLGLVGLIDAKGIDVAQPIWSWGCLT